MIQGGSSVQAARNKLQLRLHNAIDKARYLNIRLAHGTSELMNMILTTSNLDPNTPNNGVTLYMASVPTGKRIKSLGDIINHRGSFQQHVVKACATAQKTSGKIVRARKLNGISPYTIRSPDTTTALPGLC